MDVSKIAPYAKAAVAVLGALVTTATVIANGVISAEDVTTIVTAWATAFAVFQVRNKIKLV